MKQAKFNAEHAIFTLASPRTKHTQVFHILICMYGRRSTNTYSHDKTNSGNPLGVAVLNSTAVHKLCVVTRFLSSVRLHTHFSTYKFLSFVYILLRTSGLLLACHLPCLLRCSCCSSSGRHSSCCWYYY